MCFSATASFTAAGFLYVVGITALRISKFKSHYMLACIPLLFAMQQTAEGIVWLTHINPEHQFLYYLFTHVFLLFAFLVWPIWVPMSLFVSEKIKHKQNLLKMVLILGVLFAIFNAYEISSYQGGTSFIANHIDYGSGFTSGISFNLYLFIYACTTVLPCFIASFKWCKIFGVVLLISLIFTYVFIVEAFTSVWCFFAAILSVFILLMIKKNQ